jgi:hypothetical protein
VKATPASALPADSWPEARAAEEDRERAAADTLPPAAPIHWLIDGHTSCGESGTGVAIESAMDLSALALTCPMCAARWHLEVSG